MTNPPRQEFIDASCTGKSSYPDWQTANIWMKRKKFRKNSAHNDARGRATPYHCGNCSHWHIGYRYDTARRPAYHRPRPGGGYAQ